jgi:serine/threonine protein kinase
VRRSVGEPEEASRGKPAFTAPERVAGGAGDRRSDLFSVGVILWNSLTRAMLFDGPDIESTLENVLTRPVPPASRLGKSPESLDAICFKALQRQPAKRYTSAEEMLVHLRKVAAAEDVLGSPSEVKRWVQQAMGYDLDVQRLSFLDASRLAQEAETPDPREYTGGPRNDIPGGEGFSLVDRQLADFRSRREAVAKWVAVSIAVAILLLAAFLPDSIRNLKKPNAPSADAPSGANRTNKTPATGDLDPSSQ